MISSISCYLIMTMVLHEVSTDLPSYVHLHTIEEIKETNYVLLDKPDLCKSSEHDANNDILVAIKTAPANREQRAILRQTWLTEVVGHRIPYIFLMGDTTNEKLREQLLMEDTTHNDLLIGKPVDNYYNLTLKAIFLLDWVKTYCSNRWLLYVDDDTIVNIEKAIDFVASEKNETHHAIYCLVFIMEVIRDRNSPWYVPTSVWKSPFFPPYCSGTGYLITPNAAPLLHETATNDSIQPKLWIDDVYITGVVTEVLTIKIVPSIFRCCDPNQIEQFNQSITLGQSGKGRELLMAWEKIRGNLTFNTKVRASTHKISQYSRQGRSLMKRLQRSKTAFKYLVEICSTHLYSVVIMLLVLMILLYVKKRSFLRKFNFGGRFASISFKIHKEIPDLFKQ